jgi:peptidoglycan hydrolase-like protein with peptidoglycan-binding domain
VPIEIARVFDESKYARGTGAQGGQFVSKGAGGQTTTSNKIGFDGKRGTGYGNRGGDSNVKALQKHLNRLGITDAAGKPLAVDGKFGPKTTAAVKRLQRKLGLPADGKVTVALLKRLTGVVNKGKGLADNKSGKTLAKRKTDAAKKAAAPAKRVRPAKKVTPPARRGS